MTANGEPSNVCLFPSSVFSSANSREHTYFPTAMHGDKDECLKAGCDDYVAKPILVAELVNALKKCQARTHTMSSSSLKRGAAFYDENDELTDEKFTVASSVSNQNDASIQSLTTASLFPNRKKPRNF